MILKSENDLKSKAVSAVLLVPASYGRLWEWIIRDSAMDRAAQSRLGKDPSTARMIVDLSLQLSMLSLRPCYSLAFTITCITATRCLTGRVLL